MSRIPYISDYTLHRTVHDIDLEGHVIPGLTGEFLERQEGGRWATAGHYSFLGVPLFLSWGYRDELHCAWTAYRCADGTWSPPRQGCPEVEVVNALIARDSLGTAAEAPSGSALLNSPTRGGGLLTGSGCGGGLGAAGRRALTMGN